MIFISLLLGFKGGLISFPWFSQRIKRLFCHETLYFINVYKFFSNKPAALLTIELTLLLCKIKLCCVRHLVTLSFTIKVQRKIHQNFLFQKFKETKLRDSSWCLRASKPQKHLCFLLCPDYALATCIGYVFCNIPNSLLQRLDSREWRKMVGELKTRVLKRWRESVLIFSLSIFQPRSSIWMPGTGYFPNVEKLVQIIKTPPYKHPWKMGWFLLLAWQVILKLWSC